MVWILPPISKHVMYTCFGLLDVAGREELCVEDGGWEEAV